MANMSNDIQQIAVIGAGLAGLSAAYRLSQQGFAVDVYEARNRIGGRVQTVLVKNMAGDYSYAELGAQNIADGGEAKHFKSLAKEFNLALLEDEILFNSKFYDGTHYHNENDLIAKIQLSKEEINALIQTAAKKSKHIQEVIDYLPFSPLLKKVVIFWMNAYEGLPPSLLSTTDHNLTTLLAIIQGGLSAAHEITPTKNTFSRISLAQGNTQLASTLANRLAGRLHLQKVLCAISRQDNNIVLRFADGSVCYAQKLILALPAPVYKDIHFEHGVLPTPTLKAIQSMHYSRSSKILMPIHSPLLETTAVCSDQFGSFYNHDKKLLNLFALDGSKASLLNPSIYQERLAILKGGYNTSHFANSLPIEAKDTNAEKYDCPVAKSWLDDPFAQGAYSACDITLGSNIDLIPYRHIHVKRLFAPVNDQVFFVGEHTTLLDEIGTMEAAIESGERIAQVV